MCSPSIIPGSAPVSLGKYSFMTIIFQALVPNNGSQPFPNDTFLCIVVAFLTVTLLPQQNGVPCPKSAILQYKSLSGCDNAFKDLELDTAGQAALV